MLLKLAASLMNFRAIFFTIKKTVSYFKLSPIMEKCVIILCNYIYLELCKLDIVSVNTESVGLTEFLSYFII